MCQSNRRNVDIFVKKTHFYQSTSISISIQAPHQPVVWRALARATSLLSDGDEANTGNTSANNRKKKASDSRTASTSVTTTTTTNDDRVARVLVRAILTLIRATDNDDDYVGNNNKNDNDNNSTNATKHTASDADQLEIGDIVATTFAMLLDGARLPTG
jgi:hypothetical protein